MERRGFLSRLLGGAGTFGAWGAYGGATSLVINAPENSRADEAFDPDTKSPSPYACQEGFGAFSVLQGVTTSDTTQINVVLPKSARVQYRLVDSAQLRSPSRLNRVSRNDSDWAADNMMFEGLRLGQTYSFEVVDETGAVLDRRELETLDVSDPSLGFAVISCTHDGPPQRIRDAMWESLAAVNPALVVMIGDNVYGAKGIIPVTPKELWSRYVEVRQLKMKFYHARRLIPSVAVWDDHDYGFNDGDHRYCYRHEALEIFNAFYAQSDVPGFYQRGPGASSWFRCFGLHLQLMDGRFFRNTKGQDGHNSLWGAEQEAWLNSSLRTTSSPVLLMNGTMFFNTCFFVETYERQFKASFRNLLARLRDHGRPVFFVAGDVHWSELSQVPARYLGYETYEIVSSGMPSNRTPIGEFLLPPPNSRRVRGSYRNHFSVIRPQAVDAPVVELEVTTFGANQKIQYRQNLAVASGALGSAQEGVFLSAEAAQ